MGASYYAQERLSISHLWASDLPSSTPRDCCWLSPLGWRLAVSVSVPPPTIGRLLTPTNTLGLPTMLRNPGVRQGWDTGPSQYRSLGDHAWREDVPAGLCPEEDIELTWLTPEVK